MAKLPQADGGPPIAACESLVEVLKTKSKVIKTYNDIKDAIKKIIKIIISIRYGIIDIADLVGAELMAAIGAAASAMAKAALSAASGALNALLERIFALLLEILLAFPNAIFSLVAIPLEKAKEAADQERLWMSSARTNIDAVNGILNKWFKGVDSSRFYNQIKDAMPHIQNALSLARQMISELDATSSSADESNAVFDESKYDNLRAEIRSAIKITQPTSLIDQKVQFTKQITEKWENQRKIEISKIEDDYKGKKQKIDEDYARYVMQDKAGIKTPSPEELTNAPELITQFESAINTISELPQTAGNGEAAVREDFTTLNYGDKIREMEANKKHEIWEVENKINYQKSVSMSDVRSAGQSLMDSFASDMNSLGTYLSNFLDNVKDAYIQNKLCQNYCNTVYNIRSLIKALINFCIKLLRGVGNASAISALIGLETSEAMISTTEGMFQNRIKDFEDQNAGKKKTSAAVMSTSISTGNVLLETADAMLNGLITDSLIALINSDDVLQAGNEDFNTFIEKLSNIPDWDGKIGIWAPHPFASTSVNPYIQLIASTSVMVVQIPIVSLSPPASQHIQGGGASSDQEDLQNTVSEVNGAFSTILNHNSNVLSVLNSYTPYQSQSCGQLKKILENAGLLDAFAMGLSLINVIAELESMQLPNLSKLIPTEKNCKDFYPDLFNDPDASVASKLSDANKGLAVMDDSVQTKFENTELSKITVSALSEEDSMPHTSSNKLSQGNPWADPYAA